ncbi:MAG TPA: TIGR03000 domain-containing protein [Pirellulales bacterium]
MLRLKLTKWLMGMAVVAATVALGAGRADAHWHHGGGWGGSCGSSGGSYGSYGGSWGSCGSCGYAVYSCYSSGGSWGSSGGSWGSSGGSWGSSGGSWGGGYSGYTVPSYSTPPMTAPTPPTAPMTTPTTPVPPAPGTGTPPGTTYQLQDAGYLLVSVPDDAKVFVNGRATTSTGNERQYVSRGLENGQRYSYEVRAEVIRDGKTVTETQTAQLTAGSQANLMFKLSAPASTASSVKPPRTALKVNVPADAKVYLSGKETTSTGTSREFTTTTLPEGSTWDNYTVRVVSNGQTKEETISLTGGEARELTFDFDAKVASAR